MPDGKVHVAAAIVALLPSGMTAMGAGCYGWSPTAVAVIAYLVGTVWLSPDLDLVSQPYMAWGPFKLIWWPYMKLVPHRGWLSHGPIVGTLARIAVLVIYASIVTTVLVFLGVVTPPEVQKALRIDLWIPVAILVGLEVSATVHIALDKLLKN